MTITELALVRLNALVNRQAQASRLTPIREMMTRAAEIDALRVIVASSMIIEEVWPWGLVDNEPGR